MSIKKDGLARELLCVETTPGYEDTCIRASKRLSELERFVSIVELNLKAGTSLSWRMQRIRQALVDLNGE